LGYDVFGLIRTDVLRRTRLQDRYVASDRVLRAELNLLGRIRILPERLFFNRDHPNRSVRAYPAHHMRGAWVDPALAGRRVFPHWRVLGEYCRAVYRAPVSGRQRAFCYARVAEWIAMDLNFARLAADVVIAVFPDSWHWMAAIARRCEIWLHREAR
jgi:hypothetical protein